MYSTEWYTNLIKPPFSPPDWIFTPVWTFLYITIFLAFFIYFKTPQCSKKSGYIYFFTQLLLNFIWSPIFFILQNIPLALFVVILMDIFTILTIRKFLSYSTISGLLLVPYLIWILFATYLNFGYLILN